MIEDKRVLAIVTARGGSKGLIRKNVKPLLGKPLIAWTIEPALKSKYIDKLIVSTDDKEIAEIAGKLGAEVPFMRPANLATDSARSIDVIFHAIEFLQDKGEFFDVIIVLQPTSPLRTTEDIDDACEFYFSKNAKSVISVCENDDHPMHTNTLPEDLSMKGFLREEVVYKSRQELPKQYRINGAIYIASREFIFTNKSFIGDETYAYIMPKLRSVDIDDEMDFALAELILKRSKI